MEIKPYSGEYIEGLDASQMMDNAISSSDTYRRIACQVSLAQAGQNKFKCRIRGQSANFIGWNTFSFPDMKIHTTHSNFTFFVTKDKIYLGNHNKYGSDGCFEAIIKYLVK
jgi:hypothetical protein